MKKQLIKIRRWRSVRFSPVISRSPRNPVFNDFDQTALGKRTYLRRGMLVLREHSGPSSRTSGSLVPAACPCASQRQPKITLASAPILEGNSQYAF